MYKVTLKIRGNSYVQWCSSLDKVKELEAKYGDTCEIEIQAWN